MTSSKAITRISDLEDRDPKSLSQHLQVSWEEILGEPDTIRSPECAWRVSNQCFNASKFCCYTFLSVVFAPVAALGLGCLFACLAFKHIWCITPCLRVWKINCAATRVFCAACVSATVAPLAGGLGAFWSHIGVRVQRAEETPDAKADVLLV